MRVLCLFPVAVMLACAHPAPVPVPAPPDALVQILASGTFTFSVGDRVLTNLGKAHKCSVTGSLPPGLAVSVRSNECWLQGTAKQSGVYTFTVKGL